MRGLPSRGSHGWTAFGETSTMTLHDLEADLVPTNGAPEKGWRLLVLEDTGELLTPDAKTVIGQGLSRFLNVVDGLIGQGLRVLVLVTTNEEIRKLHPAVARPGRCAANVSFGSLSHGGGVVVARRAEARDRGRRGRPRSRPCTRSRTTMAPDRSRRWGSATVAVPFRIGVMQLTMEPLDEMLESARVMDEAGMDTVWLAEAYPWWRKHQMEARGSTVVSALMARETERLTIGWGIISPFTRHPVQVAMDARVVQEAAGPGRFILGFGTSKIFLNNARMQTKKTLGPMRDAVEIVRGVLGGEAFSYEGDTWSADVPALSSEAHTPREVPPVYVAATAPKMQALAGEIAEGCLTPSITTPAFVRYTVGNTGSDIDIGCTVVASIDEDRDRGRDGAREIAGMYLANKVQNIQGSADTLLDLAELTQDEIRPVAEAMERGGRLAAKAEVTDEILDKCKPIAGTPADCIRAIEEYRDAGCTHVMLELWGDDRHGQIRLFGEKVLPHFRD